MLKAAAKGRRNGKVRRLIVFGLSHSNLDRLRGGEPITLEGEEFGLKGVEFFIFSGTSEQAMARELAELVGPQTDVKVDPRLRD